MSGFASGRHSLAICDRCGATVRYAELRAQMVNRADSGWRVCDDCLDIDHEQYDVGRFPIVDPQALRNPRPDRVTAQRGLFGWSPVLGQEVAASVGTVTVTVA